MEQPQNAQQLSENLARIDETKRNVLNAPYSLLIRKPTPISLNLNLLRMLRYGLYGPDAVKEFLSLPPSSLQQEWLQHMSYYERAPLVNRTSIDLDTVKDLLSSRQGGLYVTDGASIGWNTDTLSEVLPWLHLSAMIRVSKSIADISMLLPFDTKGYQLPDVIKEFWREQLEDAHSVLWRYAYGALVYQVLAIMPKQKNESRLPTIASHLVQSSWRKQFRQYLDQVTVLSMQHLTSIDESNYNIRAGTAVPRVIRSMTGDNQLFRQGLQVDVQYLRMMPVSNISFAPIYSIRWVEDSMRQWLNDLVRGPKEISQLLLRNILLKAPGIVCLVYTRAINAQSYMEDTSQWIVSGAASLRALSIGNNNYEPVFRYYNHEETSALGLRGLTLNNLPINYCAVCVSVVNASVPMLTVQINELLVRLQSLQPDTDEFNALLNTYSSTLTSLFAIEKTHTITVYQSKEFYQRAAFPTAVVQFTSTNGITSRTLDSFAKRIQSNSWREFHRRVARLLVRRYMFVARVFKMEDTATTDTSDFTQSMVLGEWYWTPEVQRSDLPALAYAPDPASYLAVRVLLERTGAIGTGQFVINTTHRDKDLRETCLVDGNTGGILYNCSAGAIDFEVHILRTRHDPPNAQGSIGPYTILKGNGYAQQLNEDNEATGNIGRIRQLSFNNLAGPVFDARDERMRSLGFDEQLRARIAQLEPIVSGVVEAKSPSSSYDASSESSPSRKRRADDSSQYPIPNSPFLNLLEPSGIEILEKRLDESILEPLESLDNELIAPAFEKIRNSAPNSPLRSPVSVFAQELQTTIERPVVLLGLYLGNLIELVERGNWDSSRCFASLVDHDGYLNSKGIQHIALIFYILDKKKQTSVRKARVVLRMMYNKIDDRWELIPCVVDSEVTSPEDHPVLIEHSTFSKSTDDGTIPVHPNITKRLEAMSL